MEASTRLDSSRIQFSDLGGISSSQQLASSGQIHRIHYESSPEPLVNSVPMEANGFLARLAGLEKEMCNIKSAYKKVVNDHNYLRNEFAKLTIANKDLQDTVYSLEVELADCDQYSRRENVEILNVPESIQQKDLEAHIIDVLKSINLDNLCSYNIVAVHRLGKKHNGRNRSVIVRFINRKHAILALKNKKLLATKPHFKNYIITENLGPKNREIYDNCYKLKRAGKFRSLWTYNGRVHVKFTDRYDEQPTKIYHFDDIEYHLNTEISDDLYMY